MTEIESGASADPPVPEKTGGGRRAGFLRLAGTLLSLGLLIYLLSQQGWTQILKGVNQIGLGRILLALVLVFISRFAVAARWHVLLRSSGIKITPAQSLRINFAGLFATNFLPTTIGGDVVRLAGALQLKLDAAIAAASLIVDRLVGMAGMAMTVPFGVPHLLSSRVVLHLLEGSQPAALAISSAVPAGGWVRKNWEKGRQMLLRLLASLAIWLKQPRALFISLVYTWIHMACLFGMLYLFFSGMQDPLPFSLVAGLYSIVYFVTLIPVSINGYGLQELSMTLVFSRLGGASLSNGLTAALLFRTLMMVASLPGAAFLSGILPGAAASQK